MKLYKKCTAQTCSFLDKDIALPADIPLGFRHNLL